jgi:hypothetical protein
MKVLSNVFYGSVMILEGDFVCRRWWRGGARALDVGFMSVLV